MSYFSLASGFSFLSKSEDWQRLSSGLPAQPAAPSLLQSDAVSVQDRPKDHSPAEGDALPWKHLPPNNTSISTHLKSSPASVTW